MSTHLGWKSPLYTVKMVYSHWFNRANCPRARHKEVRRENTGKEEGGVASQIQRSENEGLC